MTLPPETDDKRIAPPDPQVAEDDSPNREVVVLPPHVEEALREAGVDPAIPEVQRAAVVMTMYYGGPIPPAHMLAEYEKIQPGLGHKIVEWADEQHKHRRSLEALVTHGSERRMDRGQKFALTIALGSLISATIVGTLGASAGAWAIAIGIVAIGVGGPAVAAMFARTLAGAGEGTPQQPKRPMGTEGQTRPQTPPAKNNS